MGGYLSGWHGRRSSRPFFDELPRLSIGDCKYFAPGLVTATTAGQTYKVKAVRIPAGCMTAPRLICATCSRACRVLYLHGVAYCYRCAADRLGARYRTTAESPTRRAVRAAVKVCRRCKHDFKRPEGKPKWMRWATYERLFAAAEAVFPIIERDECAPYELLARVDAPRRKRGRPKKPS